MTSIIQTLKQVFERGHRHRRSFECRHCGTGVDSPGDTCPTCGDSGVHPRSNLDYLDHHSE